MINVDFKKFHTHILKSMNVDVIKEVCTRPSPNEPNVIHYVPHYIEILIQPLPPLNMKAWKEALGKMNFFPIR